jgi:hypothetical protein
MWVILLLSVLISLHRFARYGLWATMSEDNAYDGGDGLDVWLDYFVTVYRNTSLPVLYITSPVHNSLADMSAVILTQVLTERIFESQSARVWLRIDPPTYVPFIGHMIYEIAPPLTNDPTLQHITATLDGSSANEYVTVGIGTSVFALDRGGSFHAEAEEHVQQILRQADPNTVNACHVSEDYYTSTSDGRRSTPNNRFTYVIKVMAFNRAESLSRLLASLSVSDYMGQSIALEILIDGPRTADEGHKVMNVTNIARAFYWPHGSKLITKQKTNLGISGQWLNAWVPAHTHELAFIFEDDMELSPLFFKWATHAVECYYNEKQISAHESLLQAVLAATKVGNTSRVGDGAALREYTRIHAGQPIMYGVCLQQQHLDSTRYPRKLRVNNRGLPFLYSLIGTWGPLLFPTAWTAFIEWWTYKKRIGHIPLVKGTIMNEFYKQNSNIWSPWITNFAYETGMKCLYPNMVRGLSLVTNFREAGENYVSSKGAASETIRLEHLSSKVVLSLLTSFPSIEYLSVWQFDFNLRRAGSVIDSLCSDSACGAHHFENIKYSAQIAELLKVFTIRERVLALSHEHLLLIRDLLWAHLLPGSTVLHLQLSPLVSYLRFQKNLVVEELSETDILLVNKSMQHFLFGQTAVSTHLGRGLELLVIHISKSQDLQDNMKFVLERSQPPGYVLTIGLCSGAPTEIDLAFGSSCSSISSTCGSLTRYTAVGDVCLEGAIDTGGVLYR